MKPLLEDAQTIAEFMGWEVIREPNFTGQMMPEPTKWGIPIGEGEGVDIERYSWIDMNAIREVEFAIYHRGCPKDYVKVLDERPGAHWRGAGLLMASPEERIMALAEVIRTSRKSGNSI